MNTSDDLFKANKLSEYVYTIDGYTYDLQEISLNYPDLNCFNLSNEHIFDKILKGIPLTKKEMKIKELIIGEDSLKFQLMNPNCEHSITVIKKLVMKSDHDGYCSGNECEFEADLKYEIYNTENYIAKNENDGNCECNINCGGSGYCHGDSLTKKYCGAHNCRHIILEEHVIEFESIDEEKDCDVINI